MAPCRCFWGISPRINGFADEIGIPLPVFSALMAIAVVLVWAMESAGGR